MCGKDINIQAVVCLFVFVVVLPLFKNSLSVLCESSYLPEVPQHGVKISDIINPRQQYIIFLGD